MTYIELKNRTFYTDKTIEQIDNDMTYKGFAVVVNNETGKKIIITSDNLVFADEC